MKVIYVPDVPPPPPKKPSWWAGFFKKTGTIVNHDGANWILLESWSWMDYEGRDWYRYNLNIPPPEEFKTRNRLDDYKDSQAVDSKN